MSTNNAQTRGIWLKHIPITADILMPLAKRFLQYPIVLEVSHPHYIELYRLQCAVESHHECESDGE